MLNQLKGASKLAALLILLIGALEVWIMKDQRHFSIIVTAKDCSVVPVSADQRDAFNQFRPE